MFLNVEDTSLGDTCALLDNRQRMALQTHGRCALGKAYTHKSSTDKQKEHFTCSHQSYDLILSDYTDMFLVHL